VSAKIAGNGQDFCGAAIPCYLAWDRSWIKLQRKNV